MADGWEVFVNGVPSSHISADPLRLEYEYMRWIAAGCEAVIDSRLDASRLRVTHLGGGACSLARYFAARYPSARQTVVEVDAELARLVREWFDLPRAPRLKIRVGDARAVADGFRPGSRDVVIRDVFVGAVTPRPVTTMEFLAAVRRGLGPSGLYVANCGDHADLRLARSELRTMATVFARVGVIADPPMLKGRRYGNIVPTRTVTIIRRISSKHGIDVGDILRTDKRGIFFQRQLKVCRLHFFQRFIQRLQ